MQLSELSAQQKLACPACGGEAQWNPAKQALVCAYCGTESPYTLKDGGEVIEHDLVAALKAIPQSARGWQDDRRPVRCQHCQAISVFSGAQQGKACDFCGSTALVPFEETGDIIRPETLLPFAVDEPAARDRVRQWYGSRWWAPNNLNQKALTDTLHGVYLPYWTFDAQVNARYTAEAGTYYQGKDNKREIRWRRVSGAIEHFFDDTLVCGSRGVQPHLIRAVEPFPTTTDRLKPYDPGYLSGWTVERYQLDSGGRGRAGAPAHAGGDSQHVLPRHPGRYPAQLAGRCPVFGPDLQARAAADLAGGLPLRRAGFSGGDQWRHGAGGGPVPQELGQDRIGRVGGGHRRHGGDVAQRAVIPASAPSGL